MKKTRYCIDNIMFDEIVVFQDWCTNSMIVLETIINNLKIPKKDKLIEHKEGKNIQLPQIFSL